jgi:poly-gamma-glutamate capsule biosynthesis protein CapA/YwtB (metallophosphatase superfamily)
MAHTVPVNRRGLVRLVGASALLLAACTANDDPSARSTTAPPASTGTATSTPSPTPEPRSFSIVATGDVLLHERLWRQAQRDAAATGAGAMDFTPQLANIAPIVTAADLAICHLEVPLAPANGPYQGYPTFSGPPQVASALVTSGFDACSTASNHTFDQGAAGVTRTLDTLDAAGIAHAGSARTPAEAEQTTIVEVATPEGAVRLALLSYTYGFNGIPYPDGETFWANEIDEPKILADASIARQRGAEVVVVALHWGTEYDHDPNAQQADLAPRLIASPDIDLLLGHHAHVVQPIERIGGEWVVYGMGNLMANHAEPQGPKSEGLLTRFTFTEDIATGAFTVTSAEYLPLYQTYEFPLEVLAVPAALATGDTGTTSAARLQEALGRTTQIVTSQGDTTGLVLLEQGR